MTTKEQFIAKHNSLASADMRATTEILDCFIAQKPDLFKTGDYAIEKIRRPFIFWLTSLSSANKQKMNNKKIVNKKKGK